jgi:DNA polymerase III subunit gamma/tau
MSTDYMPLYRKYRPQSLPELVGQEAIVHTLSNAIHHNRLAHAYLFCGPRGTGKTSSARILAKALNCSTGPTPTPCQTCPSCISITNGSALDVTEIDAASNNGVDQIRELTERVQFRAIEGQFRIYIIDEVHMLSTAAFNALLKTLEEPPPNVIFIFATTEAHKVLPTIVSRCQRFDFSRITRPQIEGRLATVAQNEDISISPEALTYIARHAKGGMRDALSLLDQVSVLGRQAQDAPISVGDIRMVTGAMSEDHLVALTNAIAAQAPTTLLSELNQMIEHGVDSPQIVKELIQHIRNLLLIKTCPANDTTLRDVLDVSEDLFATLTQQAQRFSVEELPQMILRLAQLEGQLRNTSSPMLWLEVALLELAYRDGIQTIHALSERLQQLEAQVASGSPATSAAATKKPMQTAPKTTPSTHDSAPQAPKKPASPENHPPIQPESLPAKTQAVPVQDAPQEQTQAPAEKASPEPQAMAPETPPPTTASNTKAELGQTIFAAIGTLTTRNLLEQQCELIEATDTRLVFGFSNEALLKVFNRPDKVSHLETAVTQVMGKPMKVELSVRPAGSKPLHQPPVTTSTPASPPSAMPVSTQALPQEAPVIPTSLPEPEMASSVQAPPEDMDPDMLPKMSDGSEPSPIKANPDKSSAPVAKRFDPTTATQDELELMESKRFTEDLLQGRLLEI